MLRNTCSVGLGHSPLACVMLIAKHNKICDSKCIIKIFSSYLKRKCGLKWCWSAGHKPQHFHALCFTIILIITAVSVFPEDILKGHSIAKQSVSSRR